MVFGLYGIKYILLHCDAGMAKCLLGVGKRWRAL